MGGGEGEGEDRRNEEGYKENKARGGRGEENW